VLQAARLEISRGARREMPLVGKLISVGREILSGNHVNIRPAGPADIPYVRQMLNEYVEWIGLDLAFQEIDAELDGLPGEYAPPFGALFVAVSTGVEGRYLAMIALRPIDGLVGEMKRLYVRPEARGRGLARQLIARLCDEAKRLGYAELRLDTLPMMSDAQALYAACGFVDIAPYYDTPIAGTRFMSKKI
jgi:GNAT superfamily N-acetyltransferase